MNTKTTIEDNKEQTEGLFEKRAEAKKGNGTKIDQKSCIKIGLWLHENHMDKLPNMTEMGVVNLIYDEGPRQENGKPYWVSPHSLRNIFDAWGIDYRDLMNTRTNRGKEMNSMEFGKAITQLRKRADKLEAAEIGRAESIAGLEERIDAVERICEAQQKTIDNLLAAITDPELDLPKKKATPEYHDLLDRSFPKGNGTGGYKGNG
jgi:hypothetical protein